MIIDVVAAGGRSRTTKATTLSGHCFTVHMDEERKHLGKADLEDKICGFWGLIGTSGAAKSHQQAVGGDARGLWTGNPTGNTNIFEKKTPCCHDDG